MAETISEGATVGALAPDFTLKRDGGGEIRLADLRGQAVVLYFYPKDDTSGCTREALDFSAHADDFAAAGAVVIGVSRDSVKSHDRFKTKHDLRVVLASDEDGTVAARYGVWVEKSMYGRRYMGVERATFLIDRTGLIRRVWRKVKVPGHVAEVRAALKDL
jgi:peroxiredoxin Q/BCP